MKIDYNMTIIYLCCIINIIAYYLSNYHETSIENDSFDTFEDF